MNDNVFVRRYAEGYIQLAQETIGRQQALEELKNFKFILREQPDFKLFLETPVILNTEKFRLLDQVCRQGFSVQLRNFLCLLIQKRRIGFLLEIIDYLRVRYAYKEERNALLRVSSLLDLEILQQIKQSLEKTLTQRLKIYVQLDGELLGGIKATVGNTLIDGSLRGSLVVLKEKLMQLKMG